ncbi:DUF3450 domain-containing protein [Bowmanella sp. JS7-9]|jgi:hypothetical protein|uniref:DUF3450 domain-containing protein n=1 Tax=Pseudobowmanella zhangzhouensis TaxID=1537679 RepID=A0ABW1XLM3_9ALTE|nr:DUF3450 domain-containing protein [Bowmanella sp. JS7-9]TBX25686.1 energy transducer TonB [Bowmanella sp. JS7-9]
MSKVSKRNIISASIAGIMALGCSQMVSADPLNEIQKEEDKIRVAAVKSQKKIDGIFEQTQELLVEYRSVIDETENLKVYNDHVATLVRSQQEEIDSLQRQIDSIEETKRGVVPLMYRMIDALEQFIELDVPINYEKRKARIETLRDLMTRANVSVSEQFRKVLEAYKIENEYGDGIQAYTGTLAYNGQDITVDFFRLGRTVFLAQSLDQKSGWMWNNQARTWEVLDEEYLSSLTKAIKMARKLEPVDLIKLPVRAAE